VRLKFLLSSFIVASSISFSFYIVRDDNIQTFTDPRDNHSYNIIKIGELIWLAENLQYHTPNADCYDDLPDNCTTYGGLYPFEEALTACPRGWRLPSVKDWKILRKFVGDDSFDKIIDPSLWKIGEAEEGTNQLGLSVLPGGRKDDERWPFIGADKDGNLYSQLDTAASFWLDDKKIQNIAHWHVRRGKNEIHRHGRPPKGVKLSVRCVCDVE